MEKEVKNVKLYTVGELIDELQKFDKNTPIEVRAVYDTFMRAGGLYFSVNITRKSKYQEKILILEAPEKQW